MPEVFEEEPTRFASREADASDMRAMQEFIDGGLISEVLNVVKSGKEATVYRCRAHKSLGAPFAVAKVYHDQSHRTFQRAAIYEEGRNPNLPGQVRRAVARKTDFGRQAQGALWVGREFDMLSALNYAGADVPAPFACNEKAILMEHVGHEDRTAEQLQHARFEEGEAEEVLGRVLDNIELLMRENCVHADLSAFNILYSGGKLSIIDFPQAVDPRTNTSAQQFLERDIANVLRFFQRHGAGGELDARVMTRNLWNLWKFGEL